MVEVIRNHHESENFRKRIVTFDPTIHAGHIMTAVTILVCSITAWYNMREDIALLKKTQEQQAAQIAEITRESSDKGKDIYTVINKLRDESNQWFIRLDDKLDKKVDKKGY